jgi:hypothetical protein
MSIEPSTAPSILLKAFRWVAASKTAMMMGTPNSEALDWPASIIARA